MNESSPNIDQDFQAIVLSSCADLEVDFPRHSFVDVLTITIRSAFGIPDPNPPSAPH